MRKNRYLRFRRFLKMTQMILTIFWLTLSIVMLFRSI